MPGSTRSFTYTLTPADGDLEKATKRARKILGWACDGDKRITCHGVDGSLFGVVQLNLTIVGRDQWWARQLAQDLINMVSWGLSSSGRMDLFSERLEPHSSRGYAHGRIKTWKDRAWREQSSPSSD